MDDVEISGCDVLVLPYYVPWYYISSYHGLTSFGESHRFHYALVMAYRMRV